MLIQYPAGCTDTAYIIPDGVVEIGASSFGRCKKLTSITIPASVKTISTAAFAASSLTDVYYQGSEQEWNNIDFTYLNGNLTEARVHFNGRSEYLIGDVNDDGKVTFVDKVYLDRYLAKQAGYDETKVNLLAADVNCDGNVDEKDSEILEKHLMGCIGYEALPYRGGIAVPVKAKITECVYKDNSLTVNVEFESCLTECIAILAVYDNDGKFEDDLLSVLPLISYRATTAGIKVINTAMGKNIECNGMYKGNNNDWMGALSFVSEDKGSPQELKHRADATSTVFIIPEDRSKESEYKITDGTSSLFKTDTGMGCQYFNENEFYLAQYMVCESKKVSVDTSAGDTQGIMMYIKSINQTYDEDEVKKEDTNKDITLEQAKENYEDFGVTYELPPKRSRDNDEVKIVNHAEEEVVGEKVEVTEPVIEKENKNIVIEEEKKEDKKSELELTDDLFNLIDSMYKERDE